MLGASLRNILLYIVLGVFAFNVCTMRVAEARTETCESYPDKSCGPGCYYSEQSSKCERCPAGTYKSGVGSGGCQKCSLDVISSIWSSGPGTFNYMTGDAYTGYTSDTCPLVIRCAPGYYWKYDKNKETGRCSRCAGSTEPDTDDGGKCYREDVCGEYVNIEKCDVIINRVRDGVIVDVENNFNTACVPNTYKLTLYKNTKLETLNADYPGHEITYSDKTVYAKCNTGFASTEDATKWEDYLAEQLRHPSYYPFKKLLGYSTDKGCTNIIINKDGYVELDNNSNETHRTLNIFNKDTELYACWENGQIDVTYYQTTTSGNSSGEAHTYTTHCTLDDSQSNPPNDSGSDKPNECAFLDIGYLEGKAGEMISTGSVFKSHDCRIGKLGNNQWGDLSFCLDGVKEFAAGKYIPFVKNVTSISVAVVGATCPAGYYCSKTEQNSCPIGTTSATGATSVSACYMQGGQSGTKFCDKNGCFYLPTGIGNISYNPS